MATEQRNVPLSQEEVSLRIKDKLISQEFCETTKHPQLQNFFSFIYGIDKILESFKEEGVLIDRKEVITTIQSSARRLLDDNPNLRIRMDYFDKFQHLTSNNNKISTLWLSFSISLKKNDEDTKKQYLETMRTMTIDEDYDPMSNIL